MRVVHVADQQAEPGRPGGSAVLAVLVCDGQQEEAVGGPGAELEGGDVFVVGRVERGLVEPDRLARSVMLMVTCVMRGAFRSGMVTPSSM